MRLIAHRARRIPDQENSLSGLAGLPVDVAGIEIDVRVTADAVPVLLHDADLSRVTNGFGRVEECDFLHLQRLRLRGTDEPPPRMEDYLAQAAKMLWGSGLGPGAGGSPDIYIDIKTTEPLSVASIARSVSELPFSRGVVCLARGRAAFDVMASEGRDGLRFGLLGCDRDNLVESLDIASHHDLEVVFVRHGIDAFRANIDIIPEIRMRGMQAGGSIINGACALDFARRSGCDLVLTDIPPVSTGREQARAIRSFDNAPGD